MASWRCMSCCCNNPRSTRVHCQDFRIFGSTINELDELVTRTYVMWSLWSHRAVMEGYINVGIQFFRQPEDWGYHTRVAHDDRRLPALVSGPAIAISVLLKSSSDILYCSLRRVTFPLTSPVILARNLPVRMLVQRLVCTL